MAGFGERDRRDPLGAVVQPRRAGGRHRRLLERAQVEIAPGFAAAAREAELGKAGEAAPAMAQQPFRLARGRAKGVEVRARLGLDREIDDGAHRRPRLASRGDPIGPSPPIGGRGPAPASGGGKGGGGRVRWACAERAARSPLTLPSPPANGGRGEDARRQLLGRHAVRHRIVPWAHAVSPKAP